MTLRNIALGSMLLLVAATVGLLAGSDATAGAGPGEAGGLAAPALAGSPITVEEVVQDGDRNVLKVKNRTPFIVILNVGGVRVGWMRPYRTGVIRGLTPGYHKLYANSRYGTMSWGPRDVWVPGNWNLLY